MNIHLIIDHPDPTSYNHAVKNAFLQGIDTEKHEVNIIDLNVDQFDPIMSKEELDMYEKGGIPNDKIKEYQRRLKNADHLVLIFPIWWMVMPARMKGWMDKVLLPGFAFSQQVPPRPLLTNIKTATIFTTTAVSDEKHRLDFNNALEWVLCKGTLKFIGVDNIQWFNFGETGLCDAEKHREWLQFVKQYAVGI